MCNKKFGERSTLARHVKSVHYGEKDYKCNVCAKTISCSYYLKKHVKIVHGNLKMFDCGVCALKFKWSYQLSEHTKFAHLGEFNLHGDHLAFTV